MFKLLFQTGCFYLTRGNEVGPRSLSGTSSTLLWRFLVTDNMEPRCGVSRAGLEQVLSSAHIKLPRAFARWHWEFREPHITALYLILAGIVPFAPYFPFKLKQGPACFRIACHCICPGTPNVETHTLTFTSVDIYQKVSSIPESHALTKIVGVCFEHLMTN